MWSAFKQSLRLGLLPLGCWLSAPVAPVAASQMTVLSVQLGTGTTPQQVEPAGQSGFHPVTFATGTNPSATFTKASPVVANLNSDQGDALKLTITPSGSGSGEARDRSAGGSSPNGSPTTYANHNLLNGFFINDSASGPEATGSAGAGLTFKLEGLTAGQTYAIDVFSYDQSISNRDSIARTATYAISNGAGGFNSSVHSVSGNYLTPDFLIFGTANSDKTLTFSATSTGASYAALVNGFVVIATPEPSTLVLACCGAIGLVGIPAARAMGRRRRA